MFINKTRSMLVLAFFLTVAFAVNAQQSAPPSSHEAPRKPVSEQAVKEFASAYASVQSIQEDYSEQLQQIEDPQQAQQLQQEAQKEMLEAVQQSGMSVNEYNQMVERMDQDPQLRQRVFSLILGES
jgi:hypothetical protein